MRDLRIRYFAGAAQAAGTHEAVIAVTEGESLADLAARLGVGNDRLAKVLEVSSFVVDGVVTTDRAVLVGAAEAIDVLPPFAGG